MANSYVWDGDALARARYPQLFPIQAASGQPAQSTNGMTAGVLANRLTDIEQDPVIAQVNQIAGNVQVQQPAGTVVATFTPQVVPPFGQD